MRFWFKAPLGTGLIILLLFLLSPYILMIIGSAIYEYTIPLLIFGAMFLAFMFITVIEAMDLYNELWVVDIKTKKVLRMYANIEELKKDYRSFGLRGNYFQVDGTTTYWLDGKKVVIVKAKNYKEFCDKH